MLWVSADAIVRVCTRRTRADASGASRSGAAAALWLERLGWETPWFGPLLAALFVLLVLQRAQALAVALPVAAAWAVAPLWSAVWGRTAD